MAANISSVIFKITKAGKQAALEASGDSAKILIDLSYVAVGTSKYTPTGNETGLKNEISRGSVVSAEIDENTLRFSTTIYSDTIVPVYEMGIFTKSGVLFAVAASNSSPIVTLYPNIAFVTSFGLAVDDIDAGSITVNTDHNSVLANTLMQNHLAAVNPHPQYVAVSRFQFLLDVLFPMGYLYYSHSTTNPKAKFDQLLGIDTSWRRLAGRIIVGTDPNDNYIKDAGLTLGQKGMTDLAGSNERPNVYPLQTTHIFERYDPNDVIVTVWNISANKSSVTEGGVVRFTVTANNIPDGQILDWTVKEGRLNSASNDVTSPDKSQTGTVIIKNGSATIDFTTTPDDNAAEPQKHVRLTVGAPASLSINVPINDLGNNETALHITQSTTNGMQLDEYYKQQSGSYPTSTDKIRFIVDAGVDIIAPNTSKPALIDGDKWPSGSQIVVENRGRILGRGGAGGLGGTFLDGYSNFSANTSTPKLLATKGGNGGTAIKGDMLVENYGLIAGGGGGGGGNGSWRLKESDNYQIYMGGDSSGGGGAPLGEAFYNRTHIEGWLNEPTINSAAIDNLKEIIRLANVPVEGKNDDISNISLRPDEKNWFANYLRNTEYNYTTGYSAAPIVDALGLKGTAVTVTMPIPKTGYMTADSVGVSDSYFNDPNTYFVDTWTAGNSPTYKASLPMQNPFAGETLKGGKGGLGFTSTTSFVRSHAKRAFEGKSYESFMRAGSGGDVGESGEGGHLSHVSVYTIGSPNTFNITAIEDIPSDFVIQTTPAASGGLAGYVKEGSATITNYSAGTTKGR